MKQDIKMETSACNFKFRVSGVLCVEDKLLTVQMCHNGFYCLPGGHVELQEDTESAIIREMEEEIGCKVRITRLLGIAENFFNRKNGKVFHELGFYYLVEPEDKEMLNMEDYTIIEQDKDGDMELEFKWIPLSDLKNVNFQPTFLKEKLQEKEMDFLHYIVK